MADVVLQQGEDFAVRIEPGDAYDLVVDYQANDVGIDITGQTVVLTAYGDVGVVFTLTSGAGLTITPAAGNIVVRISGAQTTLLASQQILSSRRYTLRLLELEKTLLEGPIVNE